METSALKAKSYLFNARSNLTKAMSVLEQSDIPNKNEIMDRIMNATFEITDIRSKIRHGSIRSHVKIDKNTLIANLQNYTLMSSHLGNALRRAGYKTIGDICNATEEEIKDVRMIGKGTFQELATFMESEKLSFAKQK